MAPAKTFPSALYLEFRRDNSVNQFIFTPEAVSPSDGKVIPFGVLTRQVDASHPRRGWRTRYTDSAGATTRKVDVTTRDFTPAADLTEALSVAYGNFQSFFLHILSMKASSWELYNTPLVVGVAPDDLFDIQQGNTPSGLCRRIERVREEAGWKTLIDDSAAS